MSALFTLNEAFHMLCGVYKRMIEAVEATTKAFEVFNNTNKKTYNNTNKKKLRDYQKYPDSRCWCKKDRRQYKKIYKKIERRIKNKVASKRPAAERKRRRGFKKEDR